MQSLHDKAQEAAFNGDVIRSGREILLQGFNWESHKHDWWDNLEKKAPDLAKFGFTSIWLPPTTQAVSREGYLPQNLYSLNSCYGSEKQLKALLQKLCQHKLRSMADIVINHRVGTTQGQGGAYNCFDGIPMPWDEHAITSCSGGLSPSHLPSSVHPELTSEFRISLFIKGNQSTGCKFSGVPNIDHTQPFVQKDIIKWLLWLQETVGFQDFRFDYAKGYDAKFVKMYVEQSKPIFSVGEYWDSCSYNSSNQLDYNQDSHRQRIINWIDSAGGSCAAFDFTTKGILQEAVKGELWRLRDPQGKPPGVLGWWPSRSVTFVENHDTGSTQGHWPFPSDHLMEGYAYILTHPGIPMVFYDHLYDWGKQIQGQIAALMKIRRQQDIHSRSPIRILESHSNLYAAIIGEKLCVKIGDRSWCPTDGEWTVAASGTRYAVWCR